jgi:hypothetical protein
VCVLVDGRGRRGTGCVCVYICVCVCGKGCGGVAVRLSVSVCLSVCYAWSLPSHAAQGPWHLTLDLPLSQPRTWYSLNHASASSLLPTLLPPLLPPFALAAAPVSSVNSGPRTRHRVGLGSLPLGSGCCCCCCGGGGCGCCCCCCFITLCVSKGMVLWSWCWSHDWRNNICVQPLCRSSGHIHPRADTHTSSTRSDSGSVRSDGNSPDD